MESQILSILIGLICPWFVAIGAANHVNVLFSQGFVEKTGGKALVLGYFLVTDRTDAFQARFKARIAVRTAHYYHKLVRNIHRTVNF